MKFSISSKSIIFILTPTVGFGGTFSLHQLAKTLADIGKNVKIYHIQEQNEEHLEKTRFFENELEVCDEIYDDKENYIIVPEKYYDYVERYTHVNKIIWWLSWDFFTVNTYYGAALVKLKEKGIFGYRAYCLAPFVSILFILFGKKRKFAINKFFINANQYYHLYNCEYAFENLIKKNIQKDRMQYLCGPITFSYLPKDKFDFSVKENLIIFPKAKNNQCFINKLMRIIKRKIPNVQFEMIHNMTGIQVRELMVKAKVYVDFGFFPGPERLPREAAFSYCNIVTSNVGSAKNDSDVPIPEKYKFYPSKKNAMKIANLMVDMLINYNTYVNQYDTYREKVYQQQIEFEPLVEKIFVTKKQIDQENTRT